MHIILQNVIARNIKKRQTLQYVRVAIDVGSVVQNVAWLSYTLISVRANVINYVFANECHEEAAERTKQKEQVLGRHQPTVQKSWGKQ